MSAVCAFPPSSAAQEAAEQSVEGYVTAVHPPDGFEIGGRQVVTSAATVYKWTGRRDVRPATPTAADVQVDSYVEVSGTRNGKTINAQLIQIDTGKHVKGFGLIVKVIQSGPEPVFEADGYRIRIPAGAATKFSGDLKSLADVGTNDLLKYEAVRDKSGELVASGAQFAPGVRGRKTDAQRRQESVTPDAIPAQARVIDAAGRFEDGHQKLRMSDAAGPCGWHRLAADAALQERVWRVGMSVVPAYQRQLRPDAAARIRFRFYAVEEPQIRSALPCNGGLILLPEQVAVRLKTDDELAAVLADGVAAFLQVQAFNLSAEKYALLGADVAVVAAAASNPFALLAVDGVAAPIADHTIARVFEEQRGRMALAMVADAGYDPWAAPEAWRLLAPKKLPANAAALKYPERSEYQLDLLKLQYRKNAD